MAHSSGAGSVSGQAPGDQEPGVRGRGLKSEAAGG
jgi:hypothetical protein